MDDNVKPISGGSTGVGDKVKHFFIALKEVTKGGPLYYLWIFFLLGLISVGIYSYSQQALNGFIETNIRDQVSWGFYIANFTFLVGVAAAAVLLVIPAYLYNFKPIKEIAFLGEMLAISAIIMCMLFVTSDLGHPERVWHLLPPPIGKMNWPSSLLTWDIIVLNGYLFINVTVFFYVLYKIYMGKSYNFIMPLILLSIPWAVSIHTVTAFLYNGLVSRPYWNAGILAPRFLASAFCSGPSIMILMFQIIRKQTKIDIEDRAIFRIAELVAYAMAINLFLFGCEVFKEFYSNSVHLAPMEYMFFGLHGHTNLVPWMWLALSANVMALILFVNRKTRENFMFLNVACVCAITGVYIDKGMGVVYPGFIPGTLGEIYEYGPSSVEMGVAAGIFAIGALVYTVLLKFTVPIYTKQIQHP